MSYTGEDLVWAAYDGDLVKVRDCLEQHVDINYKNQICGNTALMLAAVMGHDNIISILLRNNADPNIKSNGGNTALMKAALMGHDNIISILLRNNADPNIKNNGGDDALQIARENGRQRCVQILEQEVNRQQGGGPAGGYNLLTDVTARYNNLVRDLTDDLTCPVCLQVPQAGRIVYQCKDGHLVCETCSEQVRNVDPQVRLQCPSCRVEMRRDENIVNLLAKKMLHYVPRRN